MSTNEFLITLFFLASMSERLPMLDAASVKLLRSCVDKSKDRVIFRIGRKKRSGIMLISRTPDISDVAKLEPDSIAIVAVTDGKRFERIPVEIIGVRVHPRKYYVCRALMSSSITALCAGDAIYANRNEIIGIER